MTLVAPAKKRLIQIEQLVKKEGGKLVKSSEKLVNEMQEKRLSL